MYTKLPYCIAPACREKRFKNACLCQVEMSRLRAVCCLSLLAEAISGLLLVSVLFVSAGLLGAWWCAGWRVHKSVHWHVSLPSQVLQSELLSELIVEETGFMVAHMSVSIH